MDGVDSNCYNNPQVQGAVQSRRFQEVASILDQEELQRSTSGSPQPQWPYAVHLLAYIYNYDLVDARFLWKRMPELAKQDEEAQAVFRLLQHMWNKEYKGTWQALASFQWRPPSLPFIAALTTRVRERVMELLSRAYATITLTQACQLVGLPEPAMLQAAEEAGWGYDPASGFLRVVRKQALPASKTGFDDLQRLSEYVVHLET